jgi:hypothetical protein
MSFLTDVFEGNFGNLGHDLTAHWQQDLPLELAAVAAPFAAFGAPALLGGAGFGAGGLFGGAGGLFGAGEATAAGAGAGLAADAGGVLGGTAAADVAGGGALGLASEGSAFSDSPGIAAIDRATAAPGIISGAGPSPLDTAAWPAGPIGAPGGASSVGAAAGDAAGGATSESGGFLNSVLSGAQKSVTSNPLGIGAAGVGLGLALTNRNTQSPNQQQMSAQAQQLAAQGQQLQSYLANGTLPPALQQQLANATAAEKARITANHAKNGMSTDPSQNSALAQELNAVDTNAVGAMAQAQIQMMQTGLNETGLSTQLYTLLTNMDRQDNTNLMNSIASFAASLSGKGAANTVQLKLA